MTTWSEPCCVTLVSTDQIALMSRVLFCLSRLNVYTTSEADSGVPLVNLTPLRIVKVSVLLPLLQAYLVASHGVVLLFSNVLTKTSGSETWPRGNGITDRL